jgi:putative nucleotidyltransferase with HDIG domain
MDRVSALAEVQARVKNPNLLKHMYAVEAVMKELAPPLGEDPAIWGLAGLLHDIDYEETAHEPAGHSLVGAEILTGLGVAEPIVHAVRVHNAAHGLPRVSLLDKALHIVDPLTGLIVAAALIHPQKKLAAIDPAFILNRFGEKHFARGANRDQILLCKQDLGLSLSDFVALGLLAMQGIHRQLGL